MKKIIDITVLVLASVLSVAAIVVSVIGQRHRRSDVLCRGINVEVSDSSTIKFLNGSEIIDRIDRDYGGYVNRPVEAVNLYEIEKCVMNQPFVRKCVAYMSDGILNISIVQCTPVVKLVNGGRVWYVDEGGECFAIGKDWCTDIPTVAGPFPVGDTEWYRALSAAFTCFGQNPRLRSELLETDCNEKGELTLHLGSGNESFIYGYPTENEDKIKRIYQYKDRIAGLYGKEYTSVNVKYSGQVVCR